jgi:osmotically-inducible protein OsmY
MKTDTQLRNDVIAELNWEPSVHAAQIGVEVKDGVVTLAGEVSSYAEKWHAERAAQRVFGVKALAVEMQVKLSALGGRNDADIAQSAKNVLSRTASVPDEAVKVMVESGWITLSGVVDWQYQKMAAVDAVRFLIGVTGVSDPRGVLPAGPRAGRDGRPAGCDPGGRTRRCRGTCWSCMALPMNRLTRIFHASTTVWPEGPS